MRILPPQELGKVLGNARKFRWKDEPYRVVRPYRCAPAGWRRDLYRPQTGQRKESCELSCCRGDNPDSPHRVLRKKYRAISSSFSTGNAATGDLVKQRVQLRYNPRKPDQFSVPQQKVGGFLLDPYIKSI